MSRVRTSFRTQGGEWPWREVARWVVRFPFLVAILAISPEAYSCAACGCGDPTLTSAGMEQPFTNRLRTSVEARYRTDAIGESGLDEYRIRELRIDAALAWAPMERLFLTVSLPVVSRWVELSDFSRIEMRGLADAELRAKAFLYRDRAFAPRLLLALTGGVKLPTASLQRRDEELLPFEAQPGTGSLDLLVQPSIFYEQGRWSWFGSLQLSLPVARRSEFLPGGSLRSTWLAQFQSEPEWAVRAALDSRFDRPATLSGQPEANTGGWVVYAGADLLFMPWLDWTFLIGSRLPVVNALTGYHEEGPVFSLAIMRDW